MYKPLQTRRVLAALRKQPRIDLDRLAAQLGTSINSLRTAIRVLVAQGKLRYRRGRGKRPNIYTVLV